MLDPAALDFFFVLISLTCKIRGLDEMLSELPPSSDIPVHSFCTGNVVTGLLISTN